MDEDEKISKGKIEELEGMVVRVGSWRIVVEEGKGGE